MTKIKNMKTYNFQSQVSSKTIYHECSVNIPFDIKGTGDSEVATLEFTLVEMRDENNGSTTIDITFISDIPDGVDEQELKNALEDQFVGIDV